MTNPPPKSYSDLHYSQQYMIVEINTQCGKLESIGKHKECIKKNHTLFTHLFILQAANIYEASTMYQELL